MSCWGTGGACCGNNNRYSALPFLCLLLKLLGGNLEDIISRRWGASGGIVCAQSWKRRAKVNERADPLKKRFNMNLCFWINSKNLRQRKSQFSAWANKDVMQNLWIVSCNFSHVRTCIERSTKLHFLSAKKNRLAPLSRTELISSIFINKKRVSCNKSHKWPHMQGWGSVPSENNRLTRAHKLQVYTFQLKDTLWSACRAIN